MQPTDRLTDSHIGRVEAGKNSKTHPLLCLSKQRVSGIPIEPSGEKGSLDYKTGCEIHCLIAFSTLALSAQRSQEVHFFYSLSLQESKCVLLLNISLPMK